MWLFWGPMHPCYKCSFTLPLEDPWGFLGWLIFELRIPSSQQVMGVSLIRRYYKPPKDLLISSKLSFMHSSFQKKIGLWSHGFSSSSSRVVLAYTCELDPYHLPKHYGKPGFFLRKNMTFLGWKEKNMTLEERFFFVTNSRDLKLENSRIESRVFFLHPWKLTWNQQITQLKRKIISTKPPGLWVPAVSFRGSWDHP